MYNIYYPYLFLELRSLYQNKIKFDVIIVRSYFHQILFKKTIRTATILFYIQKQPIKILLYNC